MIEERFTCEDGIIYDHLTNRAFNESCKMLNDFDDANKHLNRLILDIIDFIKKNDGVSRQEFADWWNERVLDD